MPEDQPQTIHQIVRSDGKEDGLTRLSFDSYDRAYDELESYYGDLCCSDDDRVDYTIVTKAEKILLNTIDTKHPTAE